MGGVEGSLDPHCNEGNDKEKDMGLHNILNESMYMLIDKSDLNNIGETVDNRFWQKRSCKWVQILLNYRKHLFPQQWRE